MRGDTNWIPIDAIAPLIADSPSQTLGFPHFYEHVHFSFRANFLIARQMAKGLLQYEKIEGDLLESIQWGDAAFALAYTPYEVWLNLEEMERRFAQPPFTAIPGYNDLTSWMDVLRERLLEQISKAEEKARHDQLYRSALNKRPQDDRIRINYANFLRAFGKAEQAIPLVEGAYRRNPTDAEIAITWFTLCSETDRLEQAAEALSRIAQISPENPKLSEWRNSLIEGGLPVDPRVQ